MLVTVRIISAGVLLLFVFATASVSKAYLIRGFRSDDILRLGKFVGGDEYASRNYNVIFPERKSFQTTNAEEIIEGRKMMNGRDFIKTEAKKEIDVRAKNRKKSRILVSRENYGARFVAFNADYKGPRHHPPKNN
ncbi:hypothetical protein ABFX02_12G091200 [Erythranthe guttata]